MHSPSLVRDTVVLQTGLHEDHFIPDFRPIWLDQLPTDTCLRIASYLHPGPLLGQTPQSRSLLSLAQTSKTQRLIVISFLSNHLHVPKQANHSFWSQWATIFADHVHNLSLFTVIPETHNLLSTSCLHRASLINSPFVINALSSTQRLRHLELHLLPFSSASHNDTLATLQKLELHSFSLFCVLHSVGACIFTKQSRMIALSAICQGLRSLKVTCFCNHKLHPIWYLIGNVPSLSRVSVDGRALQSISESDFKTLQSLDSVSLASGDISFETAARIGAPVTTFRSGWPVGHGEVLVLASCSRLLELQICLKGDACSALPKLVQALPCLTNLHLRALPKGRAMDLQYGQVLQAVTNAERLRVLRLTGLRVNTGELVNVLKYLGPRLEEFETTVDEVDASQIGQIEVLLRTAASFNAELLKFDLVSTISVGKRPCHWPSISRRASQVRLNYERLRLRAPRMYSWSLEKYIHLLEKDALHEVV